MSYDRGLDRDRDASACGYEEWELATGGRNWVWGR